MGAGSRRWGAWARRGLAQTGAGRADGRGARGRAQRARQEPAIGRRGAREAHGVGARGARPGRAWARLVHWLGQFGAHAASLGFDPGFDLGF